MESAPSNGIYIILGEINLLLTSLKRVNPKYSSNSHYDPMNEPLTRSLNDLKNLLNEHSDLSEVDPSTFLVPFLEVIKSEETSGPVTGMALTSIDKFISYNLIGLNGETTANCVQQISDSITHARFVGTDSANDEVVLMKILHVLRTLMLSPIGLFLTNSSVCEIMQSCFQICFENRLSELLRRTAEIILVDMVQLLFARLPQFKDEIRYSSIKKLTMKDPNRPKKVKKAPKAAAKTEETSESKEAVATTTTTSKSEETAVAAAANEEASNAAATKSDDEANKFVNIENIQVNVSNEESKLCATPAAEHQVSVDGGATSGGEETLQSSSSAAVLEESAARKPSESESASSKVGGEETAPTNVENQEQEYVNPRGVRFVQESAVVSGSNAANMPYGLPCVRELLRFLISLIGNKNSDLMISMGLNLITIGLESGIDHIASYQSLLAYVKDDLCRNLYNLLSVDRLSIYTNVLRVTFLLFESLRGHLKLQLEHFMLKLMEIIISESNRISNEQKEITLDFLVQILRIPGFAIEIYLNYDCSLNSSNLFEDLTKLLSKNAFSVQSLLTPTSLSLSALLTIVDNIDLENSLKHAISSEDRLTFLQNSLNSIRAPSSSGFSAAGVANIATKIIDDGQSTPTGGARRHSNSSSSIAAVGSVAVAAANGAYKPRDSTRKHRINRMKVHPESLPTPDELRLVRTKKRIIQQSVDLFNQSPNKSIQFLKDNSIFSNEPNIYINQLIRYLKETPALDKKIIGEFLSNRKNTLILDEYLKSFEFKSMRIDEALRLFLEAFRLPGESPLISNVLEHFAKHYRLANASISEIYNCFFNDDAVFTLSYAIIMLNVDQHNHNAKKQSNPMLVEEFKKNLTKTNGSGNFEDKLLEEIYQAIRSDEIVMPSEHTGAVRDNYLWKLIIRRGSTPDANYIHAPTGSYNQEIFNIVWGQTISALSFVYDKSFELSVIQKTINGFRKCAQIAAHYMMSDVFDNIVISLCKFTNLLNQSESVDQISINFGMNNKAQVACKTVFQLVHDHGDILRDGWKNILDCIIQIYKAKLLPKVLIECEDYLNPKGRIILIKEEVQIVQKPEGGSGLFSSFFPFMSSDLTSNKGPTPEEQEAMKNAQACIDECHIEQLIHDTKFLRIDSLLELVKALIFSSGQFIEAEMSSSSAAASNSQHSHHGGSGAQHHVHHHHHLQSSSSQLSNSTSLTNLSLSSEPRVDSDAAVFSLECLIKVVLQNRDRIACIWSLVRNHFYNIIVNANDYSFFLQRTVVGLLRISVRLLRREELASEVLASLRMLLMFKKKSIVKKLSRHVSFGLHDLLRTNAVNIHSNDDWSSIFTILQVYGAGATSPYLTSSQLGDEAAISDMNFLTRSLTLGKGFVNKQTDSKNHSTENLNNPKNNGSDRGYTSDSEIYEQQSQQQQSPTNPNNPMIQSALSDYAVISTNKRDVLDMDSLRRSSQLSMTLAANQYKIDLDDEGLGEHDKKAFAKCCETLTFLIRDMAHITLQNFESCIHCLRTFVEACVLGDRSEESKKEALKKQAAVKQKETSKHRMLGKQKSSQHADLQQSMATSQGGQSAASKRSNSPKYDESDEDDQFITSYETISIQLLDLLDTLHTKAASIFTLWSEEQRRISQQTDLVDSVVSNLWSKCWCPILQGIARLSCDANGEVRMHALQYLQRALLVHELQTLSAMEWEACFNKVLFPLLAKLLENIDPRNVNRMEETRMRASTLLCKVFLQHLTTLARLSTFTALWLTILDYMDRYMKSDKSDLLHDVIPESLKNMLLVMETTGLFKEGETTHFSSLGSITKDRIDSFLPGLWEDLFRVNTKNNPPPITTAVSETNIATSEVAQEEKQDDEAAAKKDATLTVENERQINTASSNIQSQSKFTKSATEIKDI